MLPPQADRVCLRKTHHTSFSFSFPMLCVSSWEPVHYANFRLLRPLTQPQQDALITPWVVKTLGWETQRLSRQAEPAW